MTVWIFEELYSLQVRAAILKETDTSMFFLMCLNEYTSTLQFVLSAGRMGEGGETEGREVDLAKR